VIEQIQADTNSFDLYTPSGAENLHGDHVVHMGIMIKEVKSAAPIYEKPIKKEKWC